jgi:uracil-DNA glycosylase
LRYQHLFTELGEKLDSVCASNLIFTRSVDEKRAGGKKMANRCWPVHEAILKIVEPEAIIVFGKLPFFFIKSKLGGTALTESPTKHGSWKLRNSILRGGAILKTEAQLIGLPHLSRYEIDSDKAVIEKIKMYLGLV